MTEYVTRRGRVLRCVIATGARGGTMDEQGLDALARALAEPDEAIGAVLLVSEWTNFCTGGNVGSFAAADDPYPAIRGMADHLHGVVRTLAATPVPVVVGVQGWAAGAGMSLVCLADVVVAGPSTRFKPAYPGIGFTPDGGMSWTLPRLVGAGRARHIILTNRTVEAAEAHAIGLVAELVADDEVQDVAARTAQALADGPTAAFGRLKALLDASGGNDLAAQLDAEAHAIATCAAGPEGQEGIRAFLARRTPEFHPGS